ncbi:MAG: hypothetical protein AB4042_14700 [Leptolyngbyaceae cyanobacterium]
MSFFNRLSKGLGLSTQLLQQFLEPYVSINPSEKQLILKDKTVAILCQQAINRVEKITNLEPDAVEGLWATVKHQNLEFKIHFTPEKITYNDDLIEGQIRLLKKIDCQTNSLAYRVVIAAWKTFLGGTVPNQVLPEGIRSEGDRLYYQFPKSQLKLIDALFTTVENNSAVNLALLKGELYLDTTITWSRVDLPKLIQTLGLNPTKS